MEKRTQVNSKEILKKAKTNDFEEFIETLIDLIPNIGGIEEYDDGTEYIDEYGGLIFCVKEAEDGFIFEFYDASYKVTKELFDELSKAIKKYSEMNK